MKTNAQLRRFVVIMFLKQVVCVLSEFRTQAEGNLEI